MHPSVLLPGDLVIVRGTAPQLIWDRPSSSAIVGGHLVTVPAQRIGVVLPDALGVIVAAPFNTHFVCVAWTAPMTTGWVSGGCCAKVKHVG